MNKYSPSDVDRLLASPAAENAAAYRKAHAAEVPEGFFADLQEHITAQVATAPVQDRAAKPTPLRRHVSPLWLGAAAAVLCLIVGVTLRYIPHHTAASEDTLLDDVYAAIDDADDDTIDEFDDIYEADIFLGEI